MPNKFGIWLVAGTLVSNAFAAQGENVYARVNQGVACLVSDSKAGQSVGSAFFVSPTLLATAHHQVAGATKTMVLLANGREVPGKVLDSDPGNDLALVAIEQPGPAVLTLSQQIPTLGEPVFTIGCPLGLAHTITRGVVSRENAVLKGKTYIQADLPINLGNSGGPLANQRGEVVGVIHGHVKKINGINFAVPSRQLQALMQKSRLPLATTPQLAVPAQAGNASPAEMLQQRIMEAPGVAEHYYNLGLLRLGEKNHEEARQLFEQALLRKTTYPEALNNYGIALHQLGRHAEGRDALLRAISQAPDYGLAYFNLGVVYASGLGDVRSAQASFKRFLALSPSPRLANAAKDWLSTHTP